MDDEKAKSDLTRLLRISTWLLNDCRTLHWARFQPGFPAEEHALGGGNYLITLGCFAVLNLSCKVLWILQGNQVWTEKEIEPIRRCVRSLRKEHPALKDVRFPRPGEINEQAAFVNFVRTLPQHLGLAPDDQKELERVWQELRNTLSHMAGLPFGASASVDLPDADSELEYDSELAILDAVRGRSISREGGRVTCRADLLARDLRKAVEWLCGEIELGAFPPERVETARNWMWQHYGAH